MDSPSKTAKLMSPKSALDSNYNQGSDYIDSNEAEKGKGHRQMESSDMRNTEKWNFIKYK